MSRWRWITSAACFLGLLSGSCVRRKREASIDKGTEAGLGPSQGEGGPAWLEVWLVGGSVSFLLDHLLPAEWGPRAPDPKGTGAGVTPLPRPAWGGGGRGVWRRWEALPAWYIIGFWGPHHRGAY